MSLKATGWIQMHDPSTFLERLRSAVDGPVQTGSSVLDLHGGDESPYPLHRPDAVLMLSSVSDAVHAVALCAEYGVPVIPYGVGSGQEGGVIPVQGGLSIVTSGLNRVLEINQNDMTCLVEAGVTRLQLESELRGTGLFSRLTLARTQASAAWSQPGRPAL